MARHKNKFPMQCPASACDHHPRQPCENVRSAFDRGLTHAVFAPRAASASGKPAPWLNCWRVFRLRATASPGKRIGGARSKGGNQETEMDPFVVVLMIVVVLATWAGLAIWLWRSEHRRRAPEPLDCRHFVGLRH